MCADPFSVMICLASAIAFADGCCACAGASRAMKANAIRRARTAPAMELAIITCSSSDNQGRSINADALGSGEDDGLREPNEQSVLDYAWNGREPIGQRPRIGNSLKGDIEYPVPLIRDESVAVAGSPQQRRARRSGGGGRRLDRATRGAKPELHHLDRQRKAAEHRHPFGLVGNHHHAGGGRGDDLLAQQRPTAALDQRQVGRDLVGAVDGQVQLRGLVQGGQRYARAARLAAGRLRCRYGDHGKTRPHPLAQQLDEMPRRRAGAEAEPHAGANEIERAGGSGTFLGFNVHGTVWGQGTPSIYR